MDLKKLGDKIAEQYKHKFADDRAVNREKVNDIILQQIKGLPKDQRNVLALYVENKVDCRIEVIEDKLDEILELARTNQKDIRNIKSVVGCNGE